MKKFITVLLLTLSLNAISQDEPGDGDAQIPIDSGLSLLLASGAAYGVGRVRHRMRK
jgi:hypothetical protein